MSTAHSPQLLFGVAEAELAFTLRILSAAGVREEAGESLHGVTATISGSFYEPGKALHTPGTRFPCELCRKSAEVRGEKEPQYSENAYYRDGFGKSTVLLFSIKIREET